MYSIILFDLDGTLIDSEEGIVNSFLYTHEKLGLPLPEKDFIRKNFIGPPLLDSFGKLCGLSEEGAQRAVEIYREYFSAKGVLQFSVYEGIEDILKRLSAEGKALALATSKYELYAMQIMEMTGLSKYFKLMVGSLKDGGRGSKAEVIEYALKRLRAEDKSQAVMVGDRLHDIEGAKAAGIDSIGVLYGFGELSELVAHGATHIAVSPEDIASIINLSSPL